MQKSTTSTKKKVAAASTKCKECKKSVAVATTDKKSRRKTSASGGGIVDDIKSLAVPFAILLAKQGLDSVLEKKHKEPADATESPSDTTKKSKRRGTLAGGQCSLCASAASVTTPNNVMSGGSKAMTSKQKDLSKKFNNIAREIESFLNKY